jgi:hypothetical protein
MQMQPTAATSMPGIDQGTASGMQGGHGMSPVDLSSTSVAAPEAHGNQPLEPQLVDGVKEFAEQALGLYGAFIIDDPTVKPDYAQEYIIPNDGTETAGDGGLTMVIEVAL